MDTSQLLAHCLDQQGSHHRGIHAAGQSQQHLLIPYLLTDQLNLVGNEVFHIPVGLCAADAKNEVAQSFLAGCLVLGPGLIPLMVHQQHRNRRIIDLFCSVDLHAIYNTVGAAVQDNTLHIRQSSQLCCSDVMGIDLAVNTQSPDLTGQAGVLITAQIQNQNHVLLHYLASQFLMIDTYTGHPNPPIFHRRGCSSGHPDKRILLRIV